MCYFYYEAGWGVTDQLYETCFNLTHQWCQRWGQGGSCPSLLVSGKALWFSASVTSYIISLPVMLHCDALSLIASVYKLRLWLHYSEGHILILPPLCMCIMTIFLGMNNCAYQLDFSQHIHVACTIYLTHLSFYLSDASAHLHVYACLMQY